jgi:predicted DNA-binding protein
MPARDLTADDIADWLTPRQAVEILNAELEDIYLSKHALLERLKRGNGAGRSRTLSRGRTW